MAYNGGAGCYNRYVLIISRCKAYSRDTESNRDQPMISFRHDGSPSQQCISADLDLGRIYVKSELEADCVEKRGAYY
jgi:hypothetical protein